MGKQRTRNFKTPTIDGRGFGLQTMGGNSFNAKPTLPKNMNKPFLQRLIEWFK